MRFIPFLDRIIIVHEARSPLGVDPVGYLVHLAHKGRSGRAVADGLASWRSRWRAKQPSAAPQAQVARSSVLREEGRRPRSGAKDITSQLRIVTFHAPENTDAIDQITSDMVRKRTSNVLF